MNARDSIALLNGLIEDGQRTGGADVSGLNTFRQRGYMILRNIFGDESPHVRSWSNIDFEPRVVFLDASENEARYRSARTSGLAVSLSLLQTAIEELELFGQDAPDSLSEETTQELPSSRRVFIVHGHDDGFKETVARLLSRLDLEPIILHEQPNKGRTIIEKFEDYADVSFAVVLLTPDDIAYRSGEDPETASPRARQNVILELGFFLGKLGRDQVAVLFRGDGNFDKPSDYDGVLYIPVDENGHWKFGLVKELKAAGIEVDANQIT